MKLEKHVLAFNVGVAVFGSFGLLGLICTYAPWFLAVPFTFVGMGACYMVGAMLLDAIETSRQMKRNERGGIDERKSS